jgi:hypothetical protein
MSWSIDPKAYSPTATFALVLIETSSVSGWSATSWHTARMLAKMAPVCVAFVSGLPFWTRWRR